MGKLLLYYPQFPGMQQGRKMTKELLLSVGIGCS
jgi:hypothetical protein